MLPNALRFEHKGTFVRISTHNKPNINATLFATPNKIFSLQPRVLYPDLCFHLDLCSPVTEGRAC